jgi:hypothetical protein
MARNRMVKPEFWSDERIGMLSHTARLLFIGMWNFADDEGKISANSVYLKSSIFPYDDIEIISSLEELESRLLICKYIANRSEFYFIYNFLKHQRIDRPNESRIPNPLIKDDNVRKFYFDLVDGICPDCGRELLLKESPTVPNSYESDNNFDWTTTLNGKDSRVLSIDHIQSLADGGNNHPLNLRAVCISCNKKKGKKTLKRQILLDDNSANSSRIVGDDSALKISKDKLSKNEDNKNEKATHPLQIFILNDLPTVSKLKDQLTENQAEKLASDFEDATIKEVLTAMENYKPLLTKYKSVNLTLRNWINIRNQRMNEKLIKEKKGNGEQNNTTVRKFAKGATSAKDINAGLDKAFGKDTVGAG